MKIPVRVVCDSVEIKATLFCSDDPPKRHPANMQEPELPKYCYDPEIFEDLNQQTTYFWVNNFS